MKHHHHSNGNCPINADPRNESCDCKPEDHFQKDNKVRVKDYPHEGFIQEIRAVKDKAIAKVTHVDGFENWYWLDELEKIPYKETYRR